MKLEDQVATREQCSRINDLMDGSEDIKTAFYWRYPTNKWIVEPEGYFNPNEEGVEQFPAYTVSELGVMLPEWINKDHKDWRICQWHNVPEQTDIMAQLDEYRISYRWQPHICIDEFPDNFTASTEAEIRAKLLIWLLEEKLTTPDQVNNRLNS